MLELTADEDREPEKKNMQEAVEFHVEGLRAEGFDVPSPRSQAAFINAA